MSAQLSFTAFSDLALVEEVSRLAGAERQATARLIAALAEFEARKLYLAQGCSSLFVYCTRVLHLSEHAAYSRIEAARVSRRFPGVLEMLDRGDLTMTSIGLLAPHLTVDNYAALLRRAIHRTKREVEEIVVSLAPRPDAPTMVRRLPTRNADVVQGQLSGGSLTETQTSEAEAAVLTASEVSASAPMNPTQSPSRIAPLAPDRYRIQFTADRATVDLLERARSLMRHVTPNGDLAVIIGRALGLLVSDLERQRFASSSRPRPRQTNNTPSSSGIANSAGHPRRRIPAAVRREVWKRDGGRCAFIGPHGRCAETAFVEFHHVRPFAAGGAATTENIELRCRAHNQYEADLFFGGIVRERRPPWDVGLEEDGPPAPSHRSERGHSVWT